MHGSDPSVAELANEVEASKTEGLRASGIILPSKSMSHPRGGKPTNTMEAKFDEMKHEIMEKLDAILERMEKSMAHVDGKGF